MRVPGRVLLRKFFLIKENRLSLTESLGTCEQGTGKGNKSTREILKQMKQPKTFSSIIPKWTFSDQYSCPTFPKNVARLWKFLQQLISIKFVGDVSVIFEKYSIKETSKNRTIHD